MSTEENKAIVRRHFEEAWSKGRVELLDDYYAFDVPPGENNSLEEHRNRILWWHKVAPGFYFSILDLLAEGDKVLVYWKVNVTYSVMPDTPHVGPMPPVGQPVEWRGMNIYRFVEGKMVSYEVVNEWKGMLVDAGIYMLAVP